MDCMKQTTQKNLRLKNILDKMVESIYAQMQVQLEERQKKKLEKIETGTVKFEQESKQELDAYKNNLEQMLEGEKQVDVNELSKLDAGIQRGKQYNLEVTELAESLSLELQDLGQVIGDMSHYQGLEKWVARISQKRADKIRLSRVKSQDVKENLQTILDYGHAMVSKLNDRILANMECHAEIDGTIITTSEKLKENQPIYEHWRVEKEKLERKMTDLQDKMDKADQTEYATLETEKQTLQKKLDESQINENNYFTIVDKAKKAIPVQRRHLQAYKDTVDSLTQLKTGLEEDIENVTQIYLRAPTIIKTALQVKAASQYDKGMKYATDITTEAVLKSAAGIQDEVASRAERPLIEEDKLEAYRNFQIQERAKFDARILNIKKAYAKSKQK